MCAGCSHCFSAHTNFFGCFFVNTSSGFVSFFLVCRFHSYQKKTNNKSIKLHTHFCVLDTCLQWNSHTLPFIWSSRIECQCKLFFCFRLGHHFNAKNIWAYTNLVSANDFQLGLVGLFYFFNLLSLFRSRARDFKWNDSHFQIVLIPKIEQRIWIELGTLPWERSVLFFTHLSGISELFDIIMIFFLLLLLLFSSFRFNASA